MAESRLDRWRRPYPRADLAMCRLGDGFRLLLLSMALAGCDSPTPNDAPPTVVSVAADCDMLSGCEAGDSDIAVRLSFDALPRALQPFPVHVRGLRGEPVEAVSVGFTMEGMDMGLNRYRMVDDGAGGWTADVILPVCMSGRSDWIATFDLSTSQRRMRIPVAFVLHK
jgi:hypothetical protein